MVYWQVLNNDPSMVVRCLLSVIEMDISFSELFAYILCGCSFPVDWWLAPISEVLELSFQWLHEGVWLSSQQENEALGLGFFFFSSFAINSPSDLRPFIMLRKGFSCSCQNSGINYVTHTSSQH